MIDLNALIAKLINNPDFLLLSTAIVIMVIIVLKTSTIERKLFEGFFNLIKNLGFVIFIISCLLMVRNLINSPYENSSKVLLSGFGLLALLGNLCFALTNHVQPDQKPTIIKAGKRFMLATLLLGFCIVLTYISSHSHIVRSNSDITLIRDIFALITNILAMITGFSFTYFAFGGFSIIYNYLLNTFELKETNKK